MPSTSVVTNFSGYTVAELSQMLSQSDPASVSQAAQDWDSTGSMLSEQASSLESQLASIDGRWTGTASDNYKKMMTDLVGGMRVVAGTAFKMRDLMNDAADALTTARAQMPAAVTVPAVDSQTAALATYSLPFNADLTPQQLAAFTAQQAAAQQAVAQQQQAVAAAATAQAKAIAVMEALASSYVSTQNDIPPSPDGVAATLPVTTPTTTPDTSTSGPSDLAGDAPSGALFGDMATAGLAVAAAAGAGADIGWLEQQIAAAPGSNGAPGGSTAPPGGNGTPLGGNGLLGGGLIAAAAAPGVGGAIGQAAALAGSNAANAAEAAAGSAAGGAPMMPMMPMGAPGATAGMGSGGRRTPPWLVERSDVWGESIPAAPGLIDG